MSRRCSTAGLRDSRLSIWCHGCTVAPSFAEVLVVETNNQEETDGVEQNHGQVVIQVGVVVPIQHFLSTAVTEVLVFVQETTSLDVKNIWI